MAYALWAQNYPGLMGMGSKLGEHAILIGEQ
jgi:hypothetical protein